MSVFKSDYYDWHLWVSLNLTIITDICVFKSNHYDLQLWESLNRTILTDNCECL